MALKNRSVLPSLIYIHVAYLFIYYKHFFLCALFAVFTVNKQTLGKCGHFLYLFANNSPIKNIYLLLAENQRPVCPEQKNLTALSSK